MDDRRFDSLARSLAEPKTRRGFLTGLGALVVAARAAGQASAQSACPPGQTANRKGDCSCPAGTDACPDGCYDLKRDLANCGQCGRSCIGGECRKGECRCPDGRQPSAEYGCVGQPTTTTTTAAPTTTSTTTTPAPTTTTTTSTTTTTAAPTTTTTSTTSTTTTAEPVVIVTGEVASTDPTSQCTNNCPYDAIDIEHGGGSLSLSLRGVASGGGTLSDPYLLLFSGSGWLDSCIGMVTFDDDGGCENDSFISIDDLAAGTYTAIVWGYQCVLGTYTLEQNTPPPC